MRNGRLTPKFGGSNPYEKLTVFQLQKRAKRGDPGACYEMDQREGRMKLLASPKGRSTTISRPPILSAKSTRDLSG